MGLKKYVLKKIPMLTLDLCKGKASEINEASHLYLSYDKYSKISAYEL